MTFQQISAGKSHTLALAHDNYVHATGLNMSGELAMGPHANDFYYAFTKTGRIARAHSITAGPNHSCAVSLQGDVSCWGLNTFGAVGALNTVDPVTTPVDIKFN